MISSFLPVLKTQMRGKKIEIHHQFLREDEVESSKHVMARGGLPVSSVSSVLRAAA